MAQSGRNIDDFTLTAGADLSTYQWTAMYLSAANTVQLATSTNSSLSVGILQNKPKSGEPAEIRDLGISKWIAGAAVTAGDPVTTNGSGRAIKVTSGGLVFGRAFDTVGADGDTLTVRLIPPVRWGQVP